MDELFDGNLCQKTKGSDPGRFAEWRGVFKGWLNELEREQGVKARRKAELAWGELLSFSERAPWEISTREVRGWVEAQVRAGRSASTIQGRITAISKFYKSEDGAAGMPGDPTEGIQRPQPAARKGDTSTLSPGQAKSILQAARGDRSPLGRRDYALLCLALSSGQRLDPLRKLKIEAIEINAEGGWVQWMRGKAIHRERIPNTARQALAEHLANIEAGSTEDRRCYVFNPTCKVFGNGEVTWLRERALTRQQVLRIVRQYANWVGIEAEQVIWQTLRNTAIYLRLRRGETVEQIHALLGKAEKAKTREQLRKLVGKPQTIQWREGIPKDTTAGGYQRGRAGRPQGTGCTRSTCSETR